MDYGEFKEKFTQDVKDRLKEEGSNIIISVNEVKKLNERYEAITAVAEGDNIGVNVGIEKFYGAYEDGASYGRVVDKAIEVIKTGIGHKPEINVEDLGDYSKMKDKLIMEVVSAEANKEMLENIPHQMLEDMAVVYRFAVESADSVQGSILITDTMVAHFGITPEQLHADAMENAPQIKPIEIKGMSEVLVEMMGIEQAEMMGLGLVPPEDEQMYVASVPDKTHGAGVLAYQDFMDQAAERAGGDFFILPSSIHEVLIVPDNGRMDLQSLENMVKEVNATQVQPSEKLTDSVYHYDSKEKVFELGEKFVQRQALKKHERTDDKEAGEKTSGEKRSVMDDLKAKKEKAARQPKKEVSEKGSRAKGGDAL